MEMKNIHSIVYINTPIEYKLHKIYNISYTHTPTYVCMYNCVTTGSEADSYSLGKCNVRWSFILAMVLVLDLLVLSILAAILSRRRSNWPKSSVYGISNSIS